MYPERKCCKLVTEKALDITLFYEIRDTKMQFSTIRSGNMKLSAIGPFPLHSQFGLLVLPLAKDLALEQTPDKGNTKQTITNLRMLLV